MSDKEILRPPFDGIWRPRDRPPAGSAVGFAHDPEPKVSAAKSCRLFG